MRGIDISVGDTVAYGKSNRDDPINIGIVDSIHNDEIWILGVGNVKIGKIPAFHSERIIVLPKGYEEF